MHIIYGKKCMYNGLILTELKFKRKKHPNEYSEGAQSTRGPSPAKSDASGLNTYWRPARCHISRLQNLCISMAWPYAWSCHHHVEELHCISVRNRGDRVVFTECDTMERRCRAKLYNWGPNLCKLSGPLGPASTMRLCLGHCSSAVH
jgi:hypothetical protein